jgi:hypothetical protein
MKEGSMGWPTDAQIDQMAETLCRMAEVPGLDRGRAIFKHAHDLNRVEWYSLTWETFGFADPLDLEVHVPHGPSYDSRAELFGVCKWEIDDALWLREYKVASELPVYFELLRERGVPKVGTQPHHLREMAGVLHCMADGEEWRRRIDDEWPPLTLVGEGN